jgi:hypothetical protein
LAEPGQPLLRDTAPAAEPLREGLDQTPAAELGPPEIGYPSLPIESARQLPVVIAQPETQRWYARMLVDRDAPGDRDKAWRLLTEAIAMYRQIGMPKHVEMAEAMLGEV